MEPLQPLGYFSKHKLILKNLIFNCKYQRRRWDSNPRSLSESPVFKTGSLNHSDTSPKQLSDSFIITHRLAFVKHFFNFFQIFFEDLRFVKAVTWKFFVVSSDFYILSRLFQNVNTFFRFFSSFFIVALFPSFDTITVHAS